MYFLDTNMKKRHLYIFYENISLFKLSKKLQQVKTIAVVVIPLSLTNARLFFSYEHY